MTAHSKEFPLRTPILKNSPSDRHGRVNQSRVLRAKMDLSRASSLPAACACSCKRDTSYFAILCRLDRNLQSEPLSLVEIACIICRYKWRWRVLVWFLSQHWLCIVLSNATFGNWSCRRATDIYVHDRCANAIRVVVPQWQCSILLVCYGDGLRHV